MKKVYRGEKIEVTRENFKKELLAQFGPTEVEDFDEVVSNMSK